MIAVGGGGQFAGEDDELSPDLMLWLLERTLDAIPEGERPKAFRELLEMFAGFYEDTNLPVPEWVVLGLHVTEGLSDSG